MSDKQKGISLRKKRGDKSRKNAPAISAPRQISAPMPAGTGLGAATLARPSQERADKTADLVKRRYSQKVMQLPSDFPGAGGPMPDLPPMPAQFRERERDKSQARNAPSQSRDKSQSRNAPALDLRALADPSLQADPYVASVLADASEGDIARYQAELRRAKQRASLDLQTNVYQNRTQFIRISNEAEKLKAEMRALRHLMADLTTTLAQTASATQPADAPARRANRSSIGDLNQIRQAQLQQLYRDVDGAQKYLPPIPGRYIVWQSRRWFELDAATLKARRRLRLLLLNDHLLLAAEKKARPDPAPRDRDRPRPALEYVAQRCFPLHDVSVARGPDERVILRAGPDAITLDTKQDDTPDKIAFLSTFRKTKDDLRKAHEADLDEKDRATDTYNHMLSRDPALRNQPHLLDSMPDPATTFVDPDGHTRNVRWVESQLDDLDIDIALQRFDPAVSKVESLKSLSTAMRGNDTAKTIVSLKVNERAAKLAALLVRQLADGTSWNGPVAQHVTWVNRLGFQDRAREAYLASRTALIKTRARQCTFEGNLPDYIFQISYIYFLVIKNTLATFQTCFPQPLMSACVKWAKEHVDAFNDVLVRQLSSVPREAEAWGVCMQIAKEHAAMLNDVGVDFEDLVGRGEDLAVRETPEKMREPVGLGVS